MAEKIAAIAIGKNEGERFLRCLASLAGKAEPIIYVDSGSTDGSVEAARAARAQVVELDMSTRFTAARARNAGLDRLTEITPDWTFVQVLDGDCELQPGWIEAGLAALHADKTLAAVCGRRREKYPDTTVWNRLIDYEWATPIDDNAKACGGDALIRRAALEDERYDPTMIAAPVFDRAGRAVVALTLLGLEPGMRGARIQELGDQVRDAGLVVTRRSGGQPPT